MNKIFKVVWNKARNCYVVGSELICNHSRGKVRVKNGGGTSTSVKSSSWAKRAQVALAVMAVCGMSFVGAERAYAAWGDVSVKYEKIQDATTGLYASEIWHYEGNKHYHSAGIDCGEKVYNTTLTIGDVNKVFKNLSDNDKLLYNKSITSGTISDGKITLKTEGNTDIVLAGSIPTYSAGSGIAIDSTNNNAISVNTKSVNLSYRANDATSSKVVSLNTGLNFVGSGSVSVEAGGEGKITISGVNYYVTSGTYDAESKTLKLTRAGLEGTVDIKLSGIQGGGWILSTNEKTKEAKVEVGAGDVVTFTGADENISVTNEDKTVKIGLNSELKGLTKVEMTNAYVTQVDAKKDTSVANVKYVNDQIVEAAVKAGKGISIENKVVSVKLKKDQKNLKVDDDGLYLNDELKVTSVNAGGTVINSSGLAVSGGSFTSKGLKIGDTIYVSSKGLNAGGQTITNVLAGKNGTDAVNVSQMNAAIAKAIGGLTADTDTHVKAGKYTVDSTNSTVTMPIVDKDGKETGKSVVINDVASNTNLAKVNSELVNTNVAVNAVNAKADANTEEIARVNDELEKTNAHFNSEFEQTNAAVNTVNAKADANTEEIARVNSELVKTNDHFNSEFEKTNAAVNAVNAKADANTEEIARVNSELVKTNNHFNSEFEKTNAAVNAVNAKADANTAKIGTTEDGTYVNKDNTIGQNLNALDGQVATNTTNITNLDERVANNSANIAANSNRITRLGERVNKVGAGAAALAALHPMDFDPDDKLTFAAGVGNYSGSNAAALGMFYRPDEKVMFSVAGTMGNGENMVNAGISFALDRTNHVSNSRTAMAREIVDLRGQLAEMGAKMAKMEAMFGMLDPAKTALFPDIPENHWAYEYVAKLAGNGIVEGYPDGSFSGDRMMTRYEFAAMLYRAIEKGHALEARILQEFAPELGRIRVERIHGADNDKHKIERVRVNRGAGYGERDRYGSRLQ